MKQINTKCFLWISGLLFAALYAFLLIYSPQESWCDDAFWSDWGRQMGMNGAFTSNVWGSGKPSYSPGYALILAGVFRLFGFSYITAQLPNIVLAFCTYILLGKALIREHVGIVPVFVLCLLFWCVSRMYSIITLGRPEVLSMLLALVVALTFVKKLTTPLLVASFLLMCTSVQGVIAATLFIFIYECFHPKEIIPHRGLLYSHFGGYAAGLAATSFLMYRNHCLKAFFDTTFGFSKTLSSFYVWLRSFVKFRIMGKAVEGADSDTIRVMSPIQSDELSFFTDVAKAYTGSPEYIVAALILVVLILSFVLRHKGMDRIVWVTTTMALITPLVYTLAGRYTSYYRWVAWIPCIYAVCRLLQRLATEKRSKATILSFASLAVLLNFIFVWRTDVEFDPTHAKDNTNIEEIALSGLDPSEPTVIPYSWYYYVIESDENVYFQWSGEYPETLTRVIADPSDESNNPAFMQSCEYDHTIVRMEEWYKIN